MTLPLRSLIVLSFATATTAQIHVAPGGSDLGAGTAGSPFQTIQHAANVAAPGSTIHLHAGVYGDEQGIATLGTKDLVLQGANVATTILRPHTSATVSLLPASPVALIAVPHRVGLLIAGPARIHVRELTIDADATTPPSGQLAGIYVRGGAEVVLDHVTIVDCRPPVFGTGTCTGLLVRGDVPIDPTRVSVRDGTFTTFGDTAVHAMLRAELDLQECWIGGSGAATGSSDQVGVLVHTSAFAVVRLSRVTDCGGPNGTAIRLDGAYPGCVVEANRIARARYGVHVRQSPAAIAPTDVRSNRIAAVDTTVRVEGASGVIVARNNLFSVSRYDPLPCQDDATGNLWNGNRFAVAPGTTSVAIPGGASTDAAPQPGLSELRELTRIGCGGAPVGVVTADFDGDGRDDFATLDQRPGGVGITVGLWRPAGHLVAHSQFATGTLRPVAIVTGSFDGAPGRDLAALTAPTPPSLAGGAVWVFANNGAGSLSLLQQIPLGSFVSPAGIAAGQWDAHAADDLTVIDFGAPPWFAGQVTLLRNGGSGVSWTAVGVPASLLGPPTALAAGDVDGDGYADVAIAEGGGASGRVHWLRGNGLGAFAAGPGSPFATSIDARAVAIADVDRDGDRDLAAATSNAGLPLQRGRLHVFDNQGGVLVALPSQPIEAGPLRLRAADLDGDQLAGPPRPELLLLHGAGGDLTVLGAFEAATGFAGGGLSTLADAPVDFDVTDFDADGFTDVIVAEPSHGGVALLRGSATARVQTIGRGCHGSFGREPRLETRGAPALPTQPNPTLQFGLVDAFPFTLAAVAVALGPAPVLVPCSYLLDVPVMMLTIVTDAAGQGSLNLPLPALPDARGLLFCAQAGVYDFGATSSFLPDFSLTAGMCLRVGD